MTPRLRRFMAMLGTLAFLAFWIWGCIKLRSLLPAGMIWDLLTFAVGGTLWGLPLIPLFRWAERPPKG